MNDLTHTQNINNSKDLKKIINLFKCKCEALNCYACFNIY